MNDNNSLPYAVMPPEWDERFDATLISWPHAATDWNYMLQEVDRCYCFMLEALLRARQTVVIVTPEPERVRGVIDAFMAELGEDNAPRHPGGFDALAERVLMARCDTNDTWIRDYGPLAMQEPDKDTLTAVSWKFNGWGLKFAADKDNLVTLQLYKSKLLCADIIARKNYVLEGGSVESDGEGTILTTESCMLSINRNGFYKRAEVEKALANGMGAQRVLWLTRGALEGDDTDGHIDTLARFAPGNVIFYVKSYNAEDPHTAELDAMEQELRSFISPAGTPYSLLALPLPDPVYDENGERLPATYANFLITPRAVIMPVYNQPRNDSMARQMLSVAFADREIITVDCSALIRQHGSLHCATMQIPRSWLPL